MSEMLKSHDFIETLFNRIAKRCYDIVQDLKNTLNTEKINSAQAQSICDGFSARLDIVISKNLEFFKKECINSLPDIQDLEYCEEMNYELLRNYLDTKKILLRQTRLNIDLENKIKSLHEYLNQLMSIHNDLSTSIIITQFQEFHSIANELCNSINHDPNPFNF
jgi:hypothetical protein